MKTDIHPIFNKLNLKIENALDKNIEFIPLDHPIYNDIHRMIDEYEDKWFLYQTFKKQEEELLGENLRKYEAIKHLLEMDKETGIILQVGSTFNTLYNVEINDPSNSMQELHRDYFMEHVPKIFPQLKEEHLDIFNGNPQLSNRKLDQEIRRLEPYIKKYENHSFAQHIYNKYNPNESDRIKLELQATADNIFKRVEEIRSGFFDIHLNTRPQKYTFNANTSDIKQSIRKETCKILEKHYGLLYNPKNGIHYISDGQGKYIEFSKRNNNLLYKPLRDQFYRTVIKDNKTIENQIIWSKSAFYKLADGYSVMESEAEKNVIGFKNCFYDIKKQTVYELDPRFPRLPMKNCRVNFVYYRNLKEKGGALKTVFEECFDQETRINIFKYYGRALFEEGYTQTQDIMFIMGKGGLGKTTFVNSISKIFNTVKQMSADKLTPDNKFAFSGLPGADFIVMDEITNAQKGFTEKLKEMTGGSDSVPIEMKGKNPINLPAEIVPRMIGIGNNLPEFIYNKFSGDGVIRRFCFIFLKRSILEAKKMTKKVNGTIYPITNEGIIIKDCKTNENGDLEGKLYDDNLNPIITDNDVHLTGIQGRTHFEVEELTELGCLEWFIQQIILHYDGGNKSLLTINVAKERALMAYLPEQWVVMKKIEPIYNNEGNLDSNEYIKATDLLDSIREELDKHMLERVIKTPFDEELETIVRNGLGISKTEELTGYSKNEDNAGEKIFYGLKLLDEPKPINYDML